MFKVTDPHELEEDEEPIENVDIVLESPVKKRSMGSSGRLSFTAQLQADGILDANGACLLSFPTKHANN